jgi:hypothetical protein
MLLVIIITNVDVAEYAVESLVIRHVSFSTFMFHLSSPCHYPPCCNAPACLPACLFFMYLCYVLLCYVMLCWNKSVKYHPELCSVPFQEGLCPISVTWLITLGAAKLMMGIRNFILQRSQIWKWRKIGPIKHKLLIFPVCSLFAIIQFSNQKIS